jgi:hypothetical protein
VRAPVAAQLRDPLASALFTLSGVNGTVRIRTPVASKMALASAAATGAVAASPADRRPSNAPSQ